MGERIIDAIRRPTDIHALTNEELDIVASEIRDEIVQAASRTGGHVASSLGAVEIILALHAELSCPHDKIVFDVGHQAYAHKILTGRLKGFEKLRSAEGVSGFPNPDESPYDVHYSGHASDALSLALGLVRARDLRGGDEKVVTVIGDASISAGMAFEALNQIGQDRADMVIVLNDNDMSISHVVGALARHFGVLRASAGYRGARDSMGEQLTKGGAIGRSAIALGNAARTSAKRLILPDSSMLYEQLGITCLAPVDGHDIAALRRSIRTALSVKGPVLVHAMTKKGHGYKPAEQNPEAFHGVGPFDPATGAIVPKGPGYSDVFGTMLVHEAIEDETVMAITAAMEEGTGLTRFAHTFPSRFVDVGICEEHAIGLAAGLATAGMKPVVAIYSTFLQRAIDQIVIDVALPRLNVVLGVDRAGIVGADGATHQGAFDLVYLRMIPNMRILAPSDGRELACALHTALAMEGPVALRYPRGSCAQLAEDFVPELLEEGKARCVREGDDVAILAFGSMVGHALEAAEVLADEGVSVRVVDMRWVKPLDEEAIEAAAATKLVVCVEDGAIAGGVGEGVLGVLARQGHRVPAITLGLPDRFISQGKPRDVYHELGLDAEGIAASVRAHLVSE